MEYITVTCVVFLAYYITIWANILYIIAPVLTFINWEICIFLVAVESLEVLRLRVNKSYYTQDGLC